MSICGWKAEFSVFSRSQNKEKIAAVLLENTFTSIPDIARLLFPFRQVVVVPLWFIPAVNNSHSFRIVKWLPVWFYKNQFKSGRKSCRITQPTLFLSGLSDQVCWNFQKENTFHRKENTSHRGKHFFLFSWSRLKWWQTCIQHAAPQWRDLQGPWANNSISFGASLPTCGLTFEIFLNIWTGFLLARTTRPGPAAIIIKR